VLQVAVPRVTYKCPPRWNFLTLNASTAHFICTTIGPHNSTKSTCTCTTVFHPTDFRTNFSSFFSPIGTVVVVYHPPGAINLEIDYRPRGRWHTATLLSPSSRLRLPPWLRNDVVTSMVLLHLHGLLCPWLRCRFIMNATCGCHRILQKLTIPNSPQ